MSDVEWPAAKVRETFIKFFTDKEHTFVPSSPTVPHNDPTLYFANAGMNQFKAIFLNEVTPESDPFMAGLKRACNSQKCIRAGGKHNDLEDVGYDLYHHTMFEMLGNWSFGDFFKVEAIDWAWELLVNVFKLDTSRIYATYYEGNEELGIPMDTEARDIWLKYLPESRVLPFGKDNFWEMGETGPCGPCSELHYDHIGNRDAASLVNMDDPTVIEIWNLVFMQYNRLSADKVVQLPAKHVDTGAGLERLTAVLQGKLSNYDIDLFRTIFARIQEVSGQERPYSGKLGDEDEGNIDTAYRIVADHIRTLVLAVTDGCVPSNTGRGYVLRRILRRAVRYMIEVLGAKQGSFQLLVDTVVEEMGGFFTELNDDVESVRRIIAEEEKSFAKTLSGGVKRFKKNVEGLSKGDRISGALVFKLYDTFGFPVDLTRRMAEERGLVVDEQEFEELKEKIWSKRSKLAEQGVIKLGPNEIDDLQKCGVEKTEDESKYDVVDDSNEQPAVVKALYIAYAPVTADAPQALLPPPIRIPSYPAPEDVPREVVKSDADGNEFKFELAGEFGVVTDKTNFYAEAGGQIYDTGSITLADGTELDVVNVQCYAHTFVLHMVSASDDFAGSVKEGDAVSMSVDARRRQPVMANHTSTHMVNHALRLVLGDHCEQQGSKVKADRFTFDFSHDAPLSAEQCSSVDAEVHGQIERDLEVFAKEVDLATAKTIAGVRHMFDEKYPDPVRVVAVGVSVDDLMADPTNEKWREFAIEFCGGTHLSRSSEASEFTVVDEQALGQGKRRITGVTGAEAKEARKNVGPLAERVKDLEEKKERLDLERLFKTLTEVDELLNTTPVPLSVKLELRARLELVRKVAADRWKKFAKTAQKAVEARFAELAEAFAKDAPAFHVEVVTGVGCNAKILNNGLKKLKGSPVPVMVVAPDLGKNKVQVMASVPNAKEGDALTASSWVETVKAAAGGGRGGGKATTAQAIIDAGAGVLDKIVAAANQPQ